MRNMLPLDVDAFVQELRDMNEVLQSYDEAQMEIVSMREVSSILKACESTRSSSLKSRKK